MVREVITLEKLDSSFVSSPTEAGWPISLSVPSLSETCLGSFTLVDSSQAGDGQSGLGNGGREVAAQECRAYSCPGGPLVTSQDIGLDCGQQRRILPAHPPPSLQPRALDLLY